VTTISQRDRWFEQSQLEPYHPYSEIVHDLIIDLEKLRNLLVDVHKTNPHDLPGALALKIDMMLLKTGEGL
jgi:hypothetical protein